MWGRAANFKARFLINGWAKSVFNGWRIVPRLTDHREFIGITPRELHDYFMLEAGKEAI